MASTPNFVNVPNTKATNFVNADGTNEKTIFTAGSNGSRVHGIFATGDDTSNRDIIFGFSISGTTYNVDQNTVPSGTTTRPRNFVNLLDSGRLLNLIADDPNLILMSGQSLVAHMATTVTSGKTVTVFVLGGDF